MILSDLIVPTAVATPRMSVEEVLLECSKTGVPGIPFRDESGQITGKISIRHILKKACIPDYLVTHAMVLGDQLPTLDLQSEEAREVLSMEIDPFVLPDSAVIASETSIAKALAVMERHDTTYLFVIDGDTYHGCISIMGIGESLIRSLENESE